MNDGKKSPILFLVILTLALSVGIHVYLFARKSGQPIGLACGRGTDTGADGKARPGWNVGIREEAPGRWFKARETQGAKLDEKQQDMMKKLESIGYLSGSRPKPDLDSVLVYDPQRTCEGLNFYCSGHDTEAVLMDMAGIVLHSWKVDFKSIFPNHEIDPISNNHQFIRRAWLGPNGDLIGIFEGIGIFKIDKDSRTIWAAENGAHHDLCVDPSGRIITLTRKARINRNYNSKKPILEDAITVLNPEGRTEKEISILRTFENSDYRPVLSTMKKSGDVLHTNTITELDGSLAHVNPAFKKGNLLISILYLNWVGVVDPEQEKMVWGMTGLWRRQHEPTLLPNGHLMIFDNRGLGKYSRVLELNPSTQEIHWKYEGGPNLKFYTRNIGTAARLPNGNTLITESNEGRAFEMTPDKTIVWEYINPNRAGENKDLIATLFDMVRLERRYADGWLNKNSQ